MSTKILIGDVFDKLRELPDNHFDVVVTSPPYWGLRKYLEDDHPDKRFEIGLEPTLGEHLDVMVRVFREVRRVMKPSASLWLNYGDCYATSPNGRSAADTKAAGTDDRTFRDKPFSTIQGVLKAKDLCMVPNRLAIALQEDGWWIRSEIVWGKSNPMPDSSGRYRPSTAHEKIFLLTKTGKSFYDSEAVRRAATASSEARWAQDVDSQAGSARANAGGKTNGPMKAVGRPDKQRGFPDRRHQGFNDRWDHMERHEQMANGRLLRNYEEAPLDVWRMGTAPFSEAHFATFPPELVERCLTAAAPKFGCCAACGKPWTRIVEKGEPLREWQAACGGGADGAYDGQATKDFDAANAQDASAVKARILEGMRERLTKGWEPSCSCAPPRIVPARVLDPFGGAGTVALVAARMGLDCTLIELNPEYVEIASRRVQGDAPLFASLGDAA